MGNYTNEKGLVVVQDNFLTKIKNFFAKAFFNRKARYEEIEIEDETVNEENNIQTFEQNEPEPKERKLYNFDADINDEEWPGDKNMNDDEKNVDNIENDNNEVNEQTMEEYYEKEEIYSEAYREKQEIEQKLLNYYESIKKRNLVFRKK
ncbi:MAG: hypothetical protein IJ890_05875 [Clostridia bacterium]|nr:hypothetical protein [Clostridia bacterium]